jgi:hypothetical protein
MFWWNWWVNVAVATGTITAVLVALFGDAFRAKFFPPKLSLELANRNGEATRVQGSAGQEEARYYHVRVSNSRRWSPANQVQIVLLQVEEPDPNRNLQVVWRGDIPNRVETSTALPHCTHHWRRGVRGPLQCR